MRHLFRLFILLLALTPVALDAQTAKVNKGIKYAPSGQRLDLCTPTGEKRETGLIFIHGGGFSSGNRGAMLGYCQLLAKGGFPSVTISYRLTSNGHSFPAALQDVSAAVTWMRTNADRLGIDPAKIVLIGYSAGGTLAMSTGLAKNSQVAGIVSAAGISDLAIARRDTPHAQLKRDIDAYLGGAPVIAASPVNQVSRGDPPVLLFHGKADRLVPVGQSVLMANKLKASRVKVLFRAFDRAGHDIMLPTSSSLKQLLRDMTRFLVAIDQS